MSILLTKLIIAPFYEQKSYENVVATSHLKSTRTGTELETDVNALTLTTCTSAAYVEELSLFLAVLKPSWRPFVNR